MTYQSPLTLSVWEGHTTLSCPLPPWGPPPKKKKKKKKKCCKMVNNVSTCNLISFKYSLRFKVKVTFGHRLRYEIKVTFGEIFLKLRQMNWNVAINNVNVVVDELPSQIIVDTCFTIDIWTQRRRCTSTRFYALRCHPPKMAGFQWNWRHKFSTLLWTPLARRKALSESFATRAVSCIKCKNWP